MIKKDLLSFLIRNWVSFLNKNSTVYVLKKLLFQDFQVQVETNA
jgi:hypothetical protein